MENPVEAATAAAVEAREALPPAEKDALARLTDKAPQVLGLDSGISGILADLEKRVFALEQSNAARA